MSFDSPLAYVQTLEGLLDISDYLTKIHQNYGENGQICATYAKIWISLLADSPLGLKPRRIVSDFSKRLVIDFFGMVRGYASLSDRITRSFDICDEGTLPTFQKEVLDCPVAKEYIALYKGSTHPLMTYVNTFLTFSKKIHVINGALTKETRSKWRNVEEELSNLRLDYNLVQDLKVVISALIRPVAWDHHVPKHGGGSVAQRRITTTHQKNYSLRYDDRIDFFFRRSKLGPQFPVEYFGPLWMVPNLNPSPGAARAIEVPKSYKTYRTVCMEPVTRMYWQQLVMSWMVQCIDESPCGTSIVLRDQTRNQSLALQGSTFYDLCTLDLSEASDRQHVDIIKHCYPNWLKYPLLATRTQKVSVGGKVVGVKKFAPMGSAVCFPTQSLTFLAIACLAKAYRLMSTVYIGFDQAVKETLTTLSKFGVYGDDIICENEIAEDVVGLLTSFGFKVNTEKSFYGKSAYRESCGAFYLDGVPCKPLTPRIHGFNDTQKKFDFSSFVMLANELGEYGYQKTRRLLISMIKSLYKPLFSTVADHKGHAIICRKPTNTHLRKRWNADLQRDEVLCTRISNKRDRHHKSDDWYYYNQWMRSAVSLNGTPSSHTKKRITIDTVCRLRWTPAYV